ncbi:hypothetical protein Lal_00009325, partial [Lupinus albus]
VHAGPSAEPNSIVVLCCLGQQPVRDASCAKSSQGIFGQTRARNDTAWTIASLMQQNSHASFNSCFAHFPRGFYLLKAMFMLAPLPSQILLMCYVVSVSNLFVMHPAPSQAKARDDNENRTRRYPPEPNPNLTGKTRYDWVRVRVRVLPRFKFWVRVRV